MSVVSIAYQIDDAVQSVEVSVDGEPAFLGNSEIQVEVGNDPDHGVSFSFLGPAGSKLRYQIRQDTFELADGVAEISEESEPYGAFAVAFRLPRTLNC